MTAEDLDTLGSTPRQMGLGRTDDVTVIDVDVTSCPVIQENMRKRKGFLPDKMLYNIGLDAASTDLVCLSPPDVVFRSSDAAMFESQLAVVAETDEIRRTGEVGNEKMREQEGEEERKGEGGEERETREKEARMPKALIIPVYYASARAHIYNKNSSSSMINDALAGGRHMGLGTDSMHPENDSPSPSPSLSPPPPPIGVQSATVTAVSAAHHGYDDPNPFPFPSPSTPCGDQQSTKLLKAYISTPDGQRIDDLNELSRVPFNAQVSFHFSLSRLLLFFSSSFLPFIPILQYSISQHYLLLHLYFVLHPL